MQNNLGCCICFCDERKKTCNIQFGLPQFSLDLKTSLSFLPSVSLLTEASLEDVLVSYVLMVRWLYLSSTYLGFHHPLIVDTSCFKPEATQQGCSVLPLFLMKDLFELYVLIAVFSVGTSFVQIHQRGQLLTQFMEYEC